MMPHLFELLQKRQVNVEDEYTRLMELFASEPIGCYASTAMQVIDEDIFRKLQLRQSFLTTDDLFDDLGILHSSENLTDLLLLIETLSTIIYQSELYIKDVNHRERANFVRRMKEIQDNIWYIVQKTNHEIKVIENFCWILEKNKLTSQVVEFVDDETIAFETIEYNHYLLKGNIEKKKAILLSLGHYIEPILQSKKLSNTSYKKLESNAGFMLNNFNIRHNNKLGKKENEFVKNIKSEELEKWYDKAYNTILMVIIADKEIETEKEIEQIKNEYTFKS